MSDGKALPTAQPKTISSTKDQLERQAIHDVIQLWTTRLSLISMVASFLSGMDTTLLSLSSTSRPGPVDTWTAADKVTNAILAAALIFHTLAAMLSFSASFILIRYQLISANMREHAVSGDAKISGDYSMSGDTSGSRGYKALEEQLPSTSYAAPPAGFLGMHPVSPAMHHRETSWSSVTEPILGRVVIRQVHLLPWRRHRFRNSYKGDSSSGVVAHASTDLDPPIALLSRCHTLCVIMSALGFSCAVTGILAFLWSSLPNSVSIVTSVCLGGCLTAMVLVLDL